MTLRSRHRNQPAIVRRGAYGTSGLVGVAEQGGVLHVEMGDLTRVVAQWTMTPVMEPDGLPYINGRRFVSVPVARRWAQDLMQKDRKAQALALLRVLEWAEGIEMAGDRHAA